MNHPSSTNTQPWFLALALMILGVSGYWAWTTQFAPISCDPQAALQELHNLSDKGIRNTGRGSSMTKLLWIYVGPKWHALPLEEKQAIDKTVSCAATTMDEHGQPTWQAAYYDYQSGKMEALTSRRYGFRLKADDSSKAPGWTIP